MQQYQPLAMIWLKCPESLVKQILSIFCLTTLCLVNTVVCASSTAPALSESYDGTRHALLVSVSEYQNLKKRFQLIGPKNDAVLVQSILEDRGFNTDNITVLAAFGIIMILLAMWSFGSQE